MITVTPSSVPSSVCLPTTLRQGNPADYARVVALHERCSDETRYRRFHTPLHRTPRALILQTLEPDNGWSVVAELDGGLVGMASVGPVSTCDLEVAILVEDAHQGQGIGTRLLQEVAVDAAARGYRTLLCLIQPDNLAVPAMIQRSGLPSTTTTYDGLMSVVMDLDAVARCGARAASGGHGTSAMLEASA